MIDKDKLAEDERGLDELVWKHAVHCDICGCHPTEDNPVCRFQSETEVVSESGRDVTVDKETPEDAMHYARTYHVVLCRRCYSKMARTKTFRLEEKRVDFSIDPDTGHKCTLCSGLNNVHTFRPVTHIFFEDEARKRGYDGMVRWFNICDECLEDTL